MALYALAGVILLANSAQSFSWSSCGDKNDVITVDNLSVSQTGALVINVKGAGNISADIQPPVKGVLSVKKKVVFGWLPVPCTNNIGSCTFDDVCTLSPYKDASCPSELQDQGLPCKCPITKGSYGGKLAIDLPAVGIPHWLEKGSYRAQMTLEDGSGRLLCLKLEMKLK